MAPSRATRATTSDAAAGPSRERPHKKSKSHPYARKPRGSNNDDALPGVQKLKSALRQTKRLLAKDSLAADVRVETERRLKALEADLAHAEQSRKERHYAAKYHKIKFFGECVHRNRAPSELTETICFVSRTPKDSPENRPDETPHCDFRRQ